MATEWRYNTGRFNLGGSLCIYKLSPKCRYCRSRCRSQMFPCSVCLKLILLKIVNVIGDINLVHSSRGSEFHSLAILTG